MVGNGKNWNDIQLLMKDAWVIRVGYGNKIRGGKKKMSGNGGVNFEDIYTKNEAVP